MGQIEFFGNKIADFSMTNKITVICIEMVQQASVKHTRMIVTCNINEN